MNYSEIKTIQNYIQSFFPKTLYQNTEKEKPNDTFVFFSNIGTSKYKAIKVYDLYDFDKLYSVLKFMKKENLGITFGSFKKNNRQKKNLFNSNAIVIDIDYKKTGFTYNQVLMNLEENYFDRIIPAPNKIEKSNQMRIIYLLEEPIFCGNKNKYRNFYQFVQDYLTSKLSEFNSDKQSINSFIRLPGSINTKNNSIVEVEDYCHNRWSLQNIVDEFLPELPEWHKDKKHKKKKNKTFLFSINKRNEMLLKDLETIQNYYNEICPIGYREKLCFLYRNFSQKLYGTEKTKEMLLNFNNNFLYPLQEKEVLSKTNNVIKKTYKYKNSTILNLLDLTEKDLDLNVLNKKSVDKKEYNKTYYEKNKKRKREKRTNKILNIILECKKIGLKNLEILKELKKQKISLALKTIEKYIHKLIVKGEYSPI